MTHSEMLAPQPPTRPGEDRRPVWGLIVADLEARRYLTAAGWGSPETRLAELCRERDKQGTAKYGVPLPVDSGRNSRLDELQEALDGMAYSRQTYEQERNTAAALETGTATWDNAGLFNAANVRKHAAWARHLRCLQNVLELLEELECGSPLQPGRG